MPNTPYKTLRDKAIKATIWKNTHDNKSFYSVDVVRGYQDQHGAWKESYSFSGSELLRVAKLYDRAYEIILVQDAVDKEQAKNAAPPYPEAAQGGSTEYPA